MTPRDLEQAIQDAFDGCLDDKRAAELRAALKASPEALALYCDHALLESELRRHAAGRGRIPGNIPARVRVAERARQRRQVLVSLFSAAAVLLVTGIVLRLVWVSRYAPLAGIQVSPGSVLTHRGGELAKDTPVELAQGVARLAIQSGVEAVIEGPATFQLRAGNRLELTSGHAWFRVSAKGRGFRVVAPAFEVVDLGTEFGIDLREDQEPQVHVLDGRVETQARGGNRQKLDLAAGQAARLKPNGRWQPVSADPAKFRKHLPRRLPELAMDFDSIEDGKLSIRGDILGATEATARVSGPARLVPGVSGMALDFNGGGTHLETNWPGISGSAPRTVALWCRIPRGTRFQTAPPLVWWGDPALGWNRKFKVALVTLSNGNTVLRTSFGDTRVDGSTGLADGEWHHLAVVYQSNDIDGSPRLRFYVDGRDEAIDPASIAGFPIETAVSGEHSGTMAIGRYELAARGRNPYLVAALDELRIFAGALSEEEIRSLAGER